MSKSKRWVLNIACKWTPNVEFDFDLCVHSRQCLTDTSKSNSTLGSFIDVCLWSFLSFLFANSALISAQQLALLGFLSYHLMLRHERWLVCGHDSNLHQSVELHHAGTYWKTLYHGKGRGDGLVVSMVGWWPEGSNQHPPFVFRKKTCHSKVCLVPVHSTKEITMELKHALAGLTAKA